MDGKMGRGAHRLHLVAAVMVATLLPILMAASVASAAPCLIFVHGKQTDTNTFTNWTAARNYWKSGSHDAIQSATKNFAASYYVVGYNGTSAYWDTGAAGEVANEIVNATNGGADGGGNRRALTYQNKTGRAGRTSCDHSSDEHPGSSASSRWSPSAWSVCSV